MLQWHGYVFEVGVSSTDLQSIEGLIVRATIDTLYIGEVLCLVR